MASLSLSLPPPRHAKPAARPSPPNSSPATASTATAPSAAPAPLRAPSYEARCAMAAAAGNSSNNNNKGKPSKPFVPRSLADFDDGGAFPEIHVAQYPRHMGNPHVKKASATASSAATAAPSTALVNVEVDADGTVSYDALVQGGTNADQQVFSKHADLVGRGMPTTDDDEAVALPTDDQVQAEAARTQAAFDALIAQKTKLDKPTGSALANAATSQNQVAQTQFIQYTPRPDAPGYNPAAAQRVIQMVPKQVDPMAPPKHKHIKAPRGPADDPVPVLHAPATKLTKEERAAWNIPACISNWKNTRGYTIPLDKRLAADGRGLRDESTISSNFATLAESLYVAEQQARKQVKLRATVQKQAALQAKEQREQELRALAQQARLERGGAGALDALQDNASSSDDESDVEEVTPAGGAPATTAVAAATTTAAATIPHDDDHDKDHRHHHHHHHHEETSEDAVAARQRERLRQERKRQREKEMRLEQSLQAKKKRLEDERDVSEKIALGVHQAGGAGGLAGEVDARLYNQSAGLDSGFGAEDDYNTYTKPLFGDRQTAAASIYRPTRGEAADYSNADEQYDKLRAGATSKFAPQKGFAGAQGGMDVSAGPRTAPVQFEKGESK